MTKKRAKHGEGTLVLRGHKYTARWMVDGKVYTRSTGTGDKRKAEKKLAEFVAPFRLGDEKAILEGLSAKVKGVEAEIQAYDDAQPALPLADGFEAYRRSTERPDTGAATMDVYESQYNRLANWIQRNYPSATEMRHVSKEMVDAFMADLAKTFTPNTYNKYITLFKRMWEVLAETARLTVNPWTKIKHKAEDKTATRRELTVEELGRVCSSLKGEMRLLFAVGIYTGLRLGDAATLDWSNIDLVRGIISVIPQKTARHAHGKRTLIPIHPTLAGMLAEIPPEERTGYVMPETAATYLADDTKLSRRIQKIFESCGIRTTRKEEGNTRARVEVGFHSLRHTFVSLSANAGVPLALVQAIVGHSNPAMTRHYFHESEAALQSAVAALPAIGTDAEPTQAASLPKSFLAALRKLTRDQLLVAQAEIAKRL